MSNDEDDSNEASYKVGYGKTPEETRFKPGTSGNPKGRPKKKDQAPTIAAAISDTFDEMVEVDDGGKISRMWRKQLIVRSLVEQAATGLKSAIRELIMLRNAVEKEPDKQPVVMLDEVEARISGRPIKNITKPVWATENWKDGVEEEVDFREKAAVAPSFRSLIEAELERRIWATDSGKKRRMSIREVIARQLTNAAIKGDVGAIRLARKLGVLNAKTSSKDVKIMIVPKGWQGQT